AIGQLDLDRRLTGDQGLGALQVHDVDIVVPDVLFKRHGKLRTFGVLDRNEVFDGHGVKHLSAEAFGQDSGANAFARGVNRSRGTGRPAADDQDVEFFLRTELFSLATVG